MPGPRWVSGPVGVCQVLGVPGPRGVEPAPSPKTATAAGCMHPTGVHSCLHCQIGIQTQTRTPNPIHRFHCAELFPHTDLDSDANSDHFP